MTWACDPGFTAEVAGSYQAVPTFAQAIQTFMAAQCALVGDHLWPEDAKEAVFKDPNYDFIVVGAGSAGAVVANRLSEVKQWKVLLIEAGGNPTLGTETPQLFFNTFNTPVDWGYKNQPQDNACRSYIKKACAWPRGKVLGGCSSVNGLYYVRANKLDYDEWAAAGNDGWGYEDVLPYFIKIENYSEPLTGEREKYHGNAGYLSVEHKEDTHDFEKLLIDAAVELGVEQNRDINGVSQMGITKSATTTKDGVRHSTARAYLSPVKDRKNLHVLKHAHVKKLVFKKGTDRVTGVVLDKDGKEITVTATKEVIVSAGAINTPQLLMLSGIGPRKHLKELGIEVKKDLPVGQNLQDHLYVPFFLTAPGENKGTLPNIVAAFSQFITEQKGPLATTAPFRVISFHNTTDPKAVSPDTQYHYLVLPPGTYNIVDIYQKHEYSYEFQEKFRKMNHDNFVIIIAAVLLKPKSKGEVRLRSTDPYDHPYLHANYFKEPEDMDTFIMSLKQHALKLGETKVIKDAGFKLELVEIDGCKEYVKGSDDYLKCWSSEMTTSLYHPTSTAKMGPDSDPSAVVDSQLRVKKVKGLRVIDASIMPDVVRGNTNGPTIMIGEKGADLVKQFWLNTHTEL